MVIYAFHLFGMVLFFKSDNFLVLSCLLKHRLAAYQELNVFFST